MRTCREWILPLRRRTGLGLALALIATPAVQAQAQPFGAAAVARFNAQDQTDRAGAQAAAEQGLAAYVQRKQQQGGAAASAFELAQPQDLARTRIAGGFEVHTIAPQDVVVGRGELRQMVQPSGIWRFFVKAGAKPVGLVTVQRMAGNWQAVSFGGAGLAQELSELMAEHAGVGAERLRFIRVHQAQADLLEVVSPTDLQARYALLGSAREALAAETPAAAKAGPAAAPHLLETYELLEPLRNAVRRNLNAQP